MHKLWPMLAAVAAACAFAPLAGAIEDKSKGTIAEIVPTELLQEALTARERHIDRIRDLRRMTIIDYSRPSGERRMFVIDFETQTAEALLVAHGRGSDPDNDGVADRFSDIPESKMTSLGAFVTGNAYNGVYGRALRLHGLERTNASAFERAIVIHGALYVTPQRRVMGRSWGCPAIEAELAPRVVEELAHGTFLYAARHPDSSQLAEPERESPLVATASSLLRRVR